MISYTIVGSADSEDLAELENYCNKVRRVFPGIDFRIVSKHEDEWEDFITSLCKLYGFKQKENPTAFTKEGRYIGGYDEMLKELETMFGTAQIALEREDVVNAGLNMTISGTKYLLKHRKKTIGDKINKGYEDHLKKGSFNFHEESFSVIDLDTKIVFGKVLQRYTPELIVKQYEEISLDELVDKQDTFDIKQTALADIRQNQDGDEDGKGKDGVSPKHRVDEKAKDEGRSPLAKSNKDEGSIKGGSRKGSGSPKAEKQDVDEVIETVPTGKEGSQEDAKASATEPKLAGSENKLPSDNHSHTNKDAADSKGELAKEMDEEEKQRKLEEEERMKVIFSKLMEIKPTIKSLKKFHVASLGNGYELCLHPDPIFKKHCILTKNGRIKYDVPLLNYRSYEEKDDMRVRISDFSQIHKLRMEEEYEKYRKQEIATLQSTTLNSRFLDFFEIFTLLDLNVINNLVDSLKCFVFYRILPKESPEEQAAPDNKLFMNQCIHLMRKEDLLDEMNNTVKGYTAFSEIELDLFIQRADGLISDLVIEQTRQTEIEKFNKRQAKVKRIEEKRARREERERLEMERLKEEQRIAEEWAQKEKEASRSPAKAAALKLEKERLEQEKIAKEKEAQEKALQEQAAKESKMASANQTHDQLPKIEGSHHTLPDGPDFGADGVIKPVDASGNIMESGIDPQAGRERHFENPLSSRFFRLGTRLLTTDPDKVEWGWGSPYRIYRRFPSETPEQLYEALSWIMKTLVHYSDEEPIDLKLMGLNLIICEDWVLLAVLDKPWITYGEKKLYWEPWSYLGFFSLPNLQKTWPETFELLSTDCHKDMKGILKAVSKP